MWVINFKTIRKTKFPKFVIKKTPKKTYSADIEVCQIKFVFIIMALTLGLLMNLSATKIVVSFLRVPRVIRNSSV